MARHKTIDAEVCAQLYGKLGTLQAVSEYLLKKGVVNPATGKAYPVATIYGAIRDHPIYLRRKEIVMNPEFAKLRKEMGIK